MYENIENVIKNYHEECQLVVQYNERISKQKIDSGIFIQTRRWIRDNITISKTHSKSQIYYKSASARRKEEYRHLTNYYYIIHPFSTFSLFWEILMFFVYIYMLVIYSFDDIFMFNREYLLYINIMKSFGDSVYLADILQFFFRGYYDTDISKTVLKPSKIVTRYLLGWFVIDFIAIIPSLCLPFYWIDIMDETKHPIIMWLRFIGIIRLLRIGRWLETLELISRYKNYSTYIYKTMKVIFEYAIILCALYFFFFVTHSNIRTFENFEIQNISVRYLKATLVLMLASHGPGKLQTDFLIQFVIALFLCVAFVLHLYLFSQLLQAWNTFIYAKTTTSNMLQQIGKYMTYKGLPVPLREKIITFFNFKFQRDYYHERRINYVVSEILRNRIILELIRKHFTDSLLFRVIPNHVLYKLVTKMKTEIYLSDDVIIEANTVNEHVYFIYHGTVAVYNSIGVEVCHLEDGYSFGEISLLFQHLKICTVVAVTSTELYKLNRADFYDVLKEYPAIREKVIYDSRNRFFEAKTGYF